MTLVDLRHLVLVRRGEEADRISSLPETDRSAVRTIEEDRRTECNRVFAAVRTMDPLQRINHLPSVLAISQGQLQPFQVQVQARPRPPLNNQNQINLIKRRLSKVLACLKRGN